MIHLFVLFIFLLFKFCVVSKTFLLYFIYASSQALHLEIKQFLYLVILIYNAIYEA